MEYLDWFKKTKGVIVATEGMTTDARNGGKRPMGRNRSNSRSSGSRSVMDIDELSVPTFIPSGNHKAQTAINHHELHETVTPETLVKSPGKTHILVLKSLNETFETKFLVIPYQPDGLKLGRPVASGGGKLSSAVTQIRSDNGNFDSRVLSRNHALLSCDAETGKIYIRDLKSSNGTFVNGNRIDQTNVELHVGDTIDLGTDIDTKMEHRKISAIVEDISIIPLVNGYKDTNTTNVETKTVATNLPKTIDHTIHNQQQPTLSNKSIGDNNFNLAPESAVSTVTAQRAAFEAAMFGNVLHSDLDDNILGVQTEILSGIFVNNSAGTSPNLLNTIKTLSTELALEKQETQKLTAMQNFLVNYTSKLDEIKKVMDQNNEKYLAKLQESLRQSLSETHNRVINERLDRRKKLEEGNESFKQERDKEIKEKQELLNKLKDELSAAQLNLEQEKKRTKVLMEKKSALTSKKDLLNGKTKSPSSIKSNDLSSNKVLITAAITVGVIAAVAKWKS